MYRPEVDVMVHVGSDFSPEDVMRLLARIVSRPGATGLLGFADEATWSRLPMTKSLPDCTRVRSEAYGLQSPHAAVSDRLVRLSRVIRAGMVTYSGLPGSRITPYLTREASGEHCARGTGFRFARRASALPVSGRGDYGLPDLTSPLGPG
jgi:hypothetical protein